jgi:hypothetical protein
VTSVISPNKLAEAIGCFIGDVLIVERKIDFRKRPMIGNSSAERATGLHFRWSETQGPHRATANGFQSG